MKMTIELDDVLLERAKELTGIQDHAELGRTGLELLVARESAQRLATLGGTQPRLRDIPRRRSSK